MSKNMFSSASSASDFKQPFAEAQLFAVVEAVHIGAQRQGAGVFQHDHFLGGQLGFAVNADGRGDIVLTVEPLLFAGIYGVGGDVDHLHMFFLAQPGDVVRHDHVDDLRVIGVDFAGVHIHDGGAVNERVHAILGRSSETAARRLAPNPSRCACRRCVRRCGPRRRWYAGAAADTRDWNPAYPATPVIRILAIPLALSASLRLPRGSEAFFPHQFQQILAVIGHLVLLPEPGAAAVVINPRRQAISSMQDTW